MAMAMRIRIIFAYEYLLNAQSPCGVDTQKPDKSYQYNLLMFVFAHLVSYQEVTKNL